MQVQTFFFFFYYFNFATRAGTQQQREPITVGPYHLTRPVYFLCGRKPECPERTHDFRQSVDFYSFREWPNHYTTEAPFQEYYDVFEGIALTSTEQSYAQILREGAT